MGGLSEENTHPFCLGSYSFSHNGTLLDYPRLMDRGVRQPKGDTDSEHLFNFLMRDFDDGDPVSSLRAGIAAVADCTPFDGLNFIFSDGEWLFAYRLGRFELHWLARPGRLLVASEKLTAEAWHTVQQDVLLVLDPRDPTEPHAERLLGDEAVARADIRRFEDGVGLRGAERGAFAAERAAKVSASPTG
jgi:predicted glutamine amidotransferase